VNGVLGGGAPSLRSASGGGPDRENDLKHPLGESAATSLEQVDGVDGQRTRGGAADTRLVKKPSEESRSESAGGPTVVGPETTAH